VKIFLALAAATLMPAAASAQGSAQQAPSSAGWSAQQIGNDVRQMRGFGLGPDGFPPSGISSCSWSIGGPRCPVAQAATIKKPRSRR
jgi:hypothetical protein